MGVDPVEGYQVENISTLQPYGVWLVMSLFNFPTALTAGPLSAVLAAGNSVVMKPAGRTPWSVRLLAECSLKQVYPRGRLTMSPGPAP